MAEYGDVIVVILIAKHTIVVKRSMCTCGRLRMLVNVFTEDCADVRMLVAALSCTTQNCRILVFFAILKEQFLERLTIVS